MNEICTIIDPKVRKLLGDKYREWNGIKNKISGTPTVICQRCKRTVDKRREAIYVHKTYCDTDRKLKFYYLCEECLNARVFVKLHREDFLPVRWTR
jgi:hypothetical protein